MVDILISDPKNLLTPNQSQCCIDNNLNGFEINGGGWGVANFEGTNFGASCDCYYVGHAIYLAPKRIQPSTNYVFSIKGFSEVYSCIGLQWFDIDMNYISSTESAMIDGQSYWPYYPDISSAVITAEVTGTSPETAFYCKPYFGVPVDPPQQATIILYRAQLEVGTVSTEWEIGNAATLDEFIILSKEPVMVSDGKNKLLKSQSIINSNSNMGVFQGEGLFVNQQSNGTYFAHTYAYNNGMGIKTSDFKPVNPSSQYSLSGVFVNENLARLSIDWYDINQQYISSSYGEDFTGGDIYTTQKFSELITTAPETAYFAIPGVQTNAGAQNMGLIQWQFEEGTPSEWGEPLEVVEEISVSKIIPLTEIEDTDTINHSENILIQKNILITEKQENLCQVNPATGGDVKGTLDGVWNYNQSTVEVTTLEAWQGNKCFKVTADSGKGIASTILGLKEGQIYTASIYFKAPVGASLKTFIYDTVKKAVVGTTNYFTGTGEWQRATVTSPPLMCQTIYSYLVLDSPGTLDFFVDGWQVEEGNVATEWKYPSLGGVTQSLTNRNQLNIQESFNPRNLFPATVADGTDTKGDITGFNKIRTTETLVRNTNDFHRGSGCLKVTTPGNQTSEGVCTDYVTVTNGQTYTLSIWTKSAVGTILWVQLSDGSDAALAVQVNGTGYWQKSIVSVTADSHLRLRAEIKNYNTSVIDFYIDTLQLELGTSASAWQPGNLLTYNQQTVETDLTTITAWSTNTAHALSRDTVEKYSGSASAKVVSNYASPQAMAISLYNYKGTLAYPGRTYLATVKAKRTGATDTMGLWIKFMDTNFSQISYAYQAFSKMNGEWKTMSVAGVAPAGTVYVYVTVDGGNFAQNEYMNVDDSWLIEYSIDDINLTSKPSIQEIIPFSKNKTYKNIATCGDALGTTAGMYGNSGVNISYTTAEKYSGYGCVRGDVTTTVSGKGILVAGGTSGVQLKPNTPHTCSLRIKTQLATPTNIQLLAESYSKNGIWLGVTQVNFPSSGEWQRINLTHTTYPGAFSISFSARLQDAVSGDIIWIDEVQIEEGNTLTDWVSPELTENFLIKNNLNVSESQGNILYSGNALCNSINAVYGLKGTETITTDTSNPLYSANCIKVVTPGGAVSEGIVIYDYFGGVRTRNIAVPGQTYTMAMWVKGTGNVQLGIEQWNDAGTSNPQTVTTSSVVALTSSYQKISVTVTLDSATKRITPRLLTASTAQAITFYIGAMHLAKASAIDNWSYPSIGNTGEKLSLSNKMGLSEIKGNLATPSMANCISGIIAYYDTVITQNLSTPSPAVGTNVAKIDTTTKAGDGHPLHGAILMDANVYPSGFTYTASCYVQAPAGTTIYYGYRAFRSQGGSENPYQGTLTATGGWDRVSCTYTTVWEATTLGMEITVAGTVSTVFYLSGFQIEAGSTMTAWMKPSIRYIKEATALTNKPEKISDRLSTKNISTPNQATCTNAHATTGDFTAYKGSSISSTTEDYYMGSRCLKIVCPGDQNRNGALAPNISLKPNTTYTCSIRIKAAAGAPLWLSLTNNVNKSSKTYFTADGTWQLATVTFTSNNLMNGHTIVMGVDDLHTWAGTIYVGMIQVEEGSVATAWEYPGLNDSFSTKMNFITYQVTGKNLLALDSAVGGDISQSANAFVAINGASKAYVTTEKYQGNGCIATTTNGSITGEGITVSPAPRVNKGAYTLQARVKAPVGARMKMQMDYAGSIYFTGTGNWDLITVAVNTTFASGGTTFKVVTVTDIQAITFYVDALMVEEGSVSSPWEVPGVPDTFNIKVNSLITDSKSSSDALSFKISVPAVDVRSVADSLSIINKLKTYELMGKNLLSYNFATGGRNNSLINIVRTNSGGNIIDMSLDSVSPFAPNYSLKGVVSTGTGSNYVAMRTDPPIPIIGGKTYTFSGWIKSSMMSSRNHGLMIDWWKDINVGWISSSTKYVNTVTINDWTFYSLTAVAPANAVYAYPSVRILNPIAGDTIWLGQAQFELGAESAFSYPGAADVSNVLTNKFSTSESATFEESSILNTALSLLSAGVALDSLTTHVKVDGSDVISHYDDSHMHGYFNSPDLSTGYDFTKINAVLSVLSSGIALDSILTHINYQITQLVSGSTELSVMSKLSNLDMGVFSDYAQVYNHLNVLGVGNSIDDLLIHIYYKVFEEGQGVSAESLKIITHLMEHVSVLEIFTQKLLTQIREDAVNLEELRLLIELEILKDDSASLDEFNFLVNLIFEDAANVKDIVTYVLFATYCAVIFDLMSEQDLIIETETTDNLTFKTSTEESLNIDIDSLTDLILELESETNIIMRDEPQGE